MRSNRKTLALTINADAQLVVRAPLRMPEKDIQAFVEKKSQWIARKQKQVLDAAARHKLFRLEDGESILFLGKQRIVFLEDVPEILIEESRITIPKNMTLEGFIRWVKGKSEIVIGERVEHYASLMNVSYTVIKMSNAKKRWGSCSAQDRLNFAWRLVMCPAWVIDYVVVHELSHISFKDHSPRFWALVATQILNYKEARSWLRSNHKLVDVL